MPSFLSPETKYLLTSMLVVDPMKRITIQEIRQNPWFNTNLPEYLCPLPHTEEELCHPVDDRIVMELSQVRRTYFVYYCSLSQNVTENGLSR